MLQKKQIDLSSRAHLPAILANPDENAATKFLEFFAAGSGTLDDIRLITPMPPRIAPTNIPRSSSGSA